MSIISNVHQFHPLKEAKVLSGQRLARVIAKAQKDGSYPSSNLTESLGVSIPLISDDEIANVIDQLLPHVRSMCENAQDGLIREFRVEHGRNEIPQEAIAIDKVIEYLESSSNGSRVTTEYLQQWFTEGYSEAATRFVRAAIDGAADEIVEKKVNLIRDMFAGFASPRFSPEIPKCKAMIRFSSYVGEENQCGRMQAFTKRAIEILKKKEEEMSADALGF